METILLLATKPIDAHQSLSYICEDIKANPEADHQLYFSRMMFGAFTISKGSVEETDLGGGLTKKDCALTGEHELIIFPAAYEEQLEKLKTSGKTLVLVRNCMCIAGPSDKKVTLRKHIIDWLLDDETRWNYAFAGLENEEDPDS